MLLDLKVLYNLKKKKQYRYNAQITIIIRISSIQAYKIHKLIKKIIQNMHTKLCSHTQDRTHTMPIIYIYTKHMHNGMHTHTAGGQEE